jgi:hypothetical protein
LLALVDAAIIALYAGEIEVAKARLQVLAEAVRVRRAAARRFVGNQEAVASGVECDGACVAARIALVLDQLRYRLPEITIVLHDQYGSQVSGHRRLEPSTARDGSTVCR